MSNEKKLQILTAVSFCGNLKVRKTKEGDGKMLKDKIECLREKLDNLVVKNAPYEEIYKLSQQLDKYIAEYYREEEK